ncbi:MAG: PQQ-binding-like beta-propeller repeat protein [Gammaproteobacteria bacterium]
MRRHFLSLTLAVLFAAPAVAAAAAWPMLMGDPRHAGRIIGPRLAPERFTLAGKFSVGAELRASPVVAAGVLFAGAENGNLYAIDVKTRQLKWIYHAAGGISSTPAVVDGMVFVLARDGQVHAVEAASGKPVWTFRTQGEAAFSTYGLYETPLAAGLVPDPWDFYLSSPLAHKGRIYVGSSDARVYALDAKTGKLEWTYKTGGMVHSSPVLAGANIVVGSWDGAVYALDADSGALRWRYQTMTEQKASVMLGIQGSGSVDGDTVYIGSRDAFLYALDANSGMVKWRYDAKGAWVAGTPAVDDEMVHVGTSDSYLFVGVDKRTGKERYRYDTRVWNFASPLRVGDLLIGASMAGQLVALDAKSGALRWSYRTPQATANAYGALGADGKLDTHRLFDGGPHALQSALEHVKRLGAFIASPIWHEGQLIAASANGDILFFEAPAR